MSVINLHTRCTYIVLIEVKNIVWIDMSMFLAARLSFTITFRQLSATVQPMYYNIQFLTLYIKYFLAYGEALLFVFLSLHSVVIVGTSDVLQSTLCTMYSNLLRLTKALRVIQQYAYLLNFSILQLLLRVCKDKLVYI